MLPFVEGDPKKVTTPISVSYLLKNRKQSKLFGKYMVHIDLSRKKIEKNTT